VVEALGAFAVDADVVGGPAGAKLGALEQEVSDELWEAAIVGIAACFGAQGGGGAGVVIASQSGHRLGALTADQNAALATTPADELLRLPMLQPDQVSDPLHAYQLAKRGTRCA
jgi:hypothetical protein